MGAVSYPFQIPDQLNATAPLEFQGASRDQVKLMVLHSQNGDVSHSQFNKIDEFLNEGDVVILNNSRTIPPVLKAKQGSSDVEVRLSRNVSPNCWEALLIGDFIQANTPLTFNNGLKAVIAGVGSERPLVKLSFSKKGAELLDDIYRYGEPIRYEYINTPWPLEMYQTVYASAPGSVEMPSAGRAFSWNVLNKLQQKGVKLGFLQLHTGLSYYENDRWPDPKHHPEAYHVPEETAQLINNARKNGKRVIAVGTTVVRALESVVDQEGIVHANEGVTRLYIHKDHVVRSVDGLVTGLHEPEASHLDMLSAFVDQKHLMKAYRAAIQKGYLWHEFGDMNLILPEKASK